MKQGQLIIAVLLVSVIPFSACDRHNRSVNITSTCLQDNHSVYQLIKGRVVVMALTGRDGLLGPPGAPGRNGRDGTRWTERRQGRERRAWDSRSTWSC